MNMTRRAAAGLLGMLPVVGKGAVTSLAQLGQVPGGGSLVGSSMEADKPAYAPPPSDWTGDVGEKVQEPLMQTWQANRLAMQVPELRNLMRSDYYARYRYVPVLDPDIAILRSLSPMAKITYQRQRNVERELYRICSKDVYSLSNKFHAYVRSLMWGPLK